MYLKGTDTFVGGSGLHQIDWDVPRFEIGYWRRSAHRGQGYITEAVRGITGFAFRTLGANRVEIRCDVRNERSQSVAESCGYTLEAVLRNNGRRVDGSLRDTRVYSMTPSDFEVEYPKWGVEG
jgi:RimJ/RimL family protein N-acetyltransferase